MSKLFYDHLIVFEEIAVVIGHEATTNEEKEELWKIVDEAINHKVLDIILFHLPHECHEDFLERYTTSPHDETLLIYLEEKTKKDIKDIIKKETESLKQEIIQEIKNTNKKKK